MMKPKGGASDKQKTQQTQEEEKTLPVPVQLHKKCIQQK